MPPVETVTKLSCATTTFASGPRASTIVRPPRAEDDEEGEGGESDEGYYGNSQLKGVVGAWELDQFNKMTESVFAGRFLTEQKPDRRSVTFIPVETVPALKEPGIYVAVMSQPNRFRGEYQTTYFYVSDLGLHVRQYAGKGADAFVSSLTSAKGVSGVEVSWIGADGIPHVAIGRDDVEAMAPERVDR